MSKWINVKDRLPDEFGPYLVSYVHSYCNCDDYRGFGVVLYTNQEFQV